MCRCGCAVVLVQVCGSAGGGAAIPSGAAPCSARRAGSGRAAGRSRVNHGLAMLW